MTIGRRQWGVALGLAFALHIGLLLAWMADAEFRAPGDGSGGLAVTVSTDGASTGARAAAASSAEAREAEAPAEVAEAAEMPTAQAVQRPDPAPSRNPTDLSEPEPTATPAERTVASAPPPSVGDAPKARSRQVKLAEARTAITSAEAKPSVSQQKAAAEAKPIEASEPEPKRERELVEQQPNQIIAQASEVKRAAEKPAAIDSEAPVLEAAPTPPERPAEPPGARQQRAVSTDLARHAESAREPPVKLPSGSVASTAGPSPSEATDDSQAARARSGGTTSGQGSADPSSGGAGGQASYVALLQAWLERYKDYPRRAQRRGEQGTALLYFVVDRSGQVLEYRLRRSAGHRLLDQAVEDMIQRAQPLPKFPSDVAQSQLALLVPVQFSLQ
jgi:periplasmic protein TonB